MATAAEKLVSDTRSVSITHIESLYIRRALDMLVASNERLIKKEMPGSEVIRLRSEENDMLRKLNLRFGA